MNQNVNVCIIYVYMYNFMYLPAPWVTNCEATPLLLKCSSVLSAQVSVESEVKCQEGLEVHVSVSKRWATSTQARSQDLG